MVTKEFVMPAKQEALIVPAGEFKAKCLKLMVEANEKQQPITVTKRGEVMGQFVPKAPEVKPFRSIVGRYPVLRTPTEADWKKMSSEMIREVDKSTKRLARQISGDFSEK